MSATSSSPLPFLSILIQRATNGMHTLPLRLARRPTHRPVESLLLRYASTHSPPPARPYRPQTDKHRAALKRPEPEPPAPAPPPPRSRTRNLLSRYLNPFHEPEPQRPTPTQPEAVPEPRDPARGLAATTRFVKEGIIDPRYKAASRRWVLVLTSLVLAIGLTPEVWRRTIKGEKRKEPSRPKANVEGAGKEDGGKSEP